MGTVVVSVVGGALLGGTYALIALGLVLAFRATETLNFAHGQLMLVCAFLVARWSHLGVGIALVLALLVTAAVGVGFYLLVLRQMTGAPPFMSVIATLGLASILDGILGIYIGGAQYPLRYSFLPSGTVDILGAKVNKTSLVLAGITILIAVVVTVVIRFTELGTRVRAAGQDPVLASLGGIHVRRIYIGSWAIAAVLAGLAGVAYGITNIVDLSMPSVALAVFPAVLLGGIDSVEGALVGGIVIGIVQSFTASYVGGDAVYVVAFGFLLVVLLFRPQGLFGTKEINRV